MIHLTKASEAELHPACWGILDDQWQITRLPLIDHSKRLEDGTLLFARLTYRSALEVAAMHGAQLPTRDQVYKLHNVGLQLEPFTLPITMDLSGSERHDREVWRRLRSSGWDGGKPVSGAGKHWIAGAPSGRAYLAGWWTAHLERYTTTRRGPGFIQEGSAFGRGPHDDQHHDYGTTTMLVRRIPK